MLIGHSLSVYMYVWHLDKKSDVEDGHTLHLVVRQPVPLSAEGVSSQTGFKFRLIIL